MATKNKHEEFRALGGKASLNELRKLLLDHGHDAVAISGLAHGVSEYASSSRPQLVELAKFYAGKGEYRQFKQSQHAQTGDVNKHEVFRALGGKATVDELRKLLLDHGRDAEAISGLAHGVREYASSSRPQLSELADFHAGKGKYKQFKQPQPAASGVLAEFCAAARELTTAGKRMVQSIRAAAKHPRP